MEKKYSFVYLTTNLINGKQYVGSHSTNEREDGYLGSGRFFLKAIKKYGKQNFNREILKECFSTIEARNLESIYIEKHNTLYPNGYNISPKGGIGFNGAILAESTKAKIGKANTGKIRTAEMRKNISNATKGKISQFKGKHHTEETIKKIKEKRALQPEPRLGKLHTEEAKRKISEKLKTLTISNDTKNKLREASLNVQKIKCEHCGKEFTPWGLKHHQKAIIRKQNNIPNI